jgi:hypothetical protein
MATGSGNLEIFVRDALLRGQTRAEITRVLAEAGWPAEQVTLALSGYADVVFPVPVPRPRASLSAREAFLYLVLFTALYMSAFNLGAILFQLINRAFPDPAMGQYQMSTSGEAIRWAVAGLVVAFPIFLWVSSHVGREVAANPAGRLSPVRRWCTYLTLFIAVACLIGDATTLVYDLLSGELTIRFGLKALVVALIAGSVFTYYLRDLRQGERPT